MVNARAGAFLHASLRLCVHARGRRPGDDCAERGSWAESVRGRVLSGRGRRWPAWTLQPRRPRAPTPRPQRDPPPCGGGGPKPRTGAKKRRPSRSRSRGRSRSRRARWRRRLPRGRALRSRGGFARRATACTARTRAARRGRSEGFLRSSAASAATPPPRRTVAAAAAAGAEESWASGPGGEWSWVPPRTMRRINGPRRWQRSPRRART